jgi:long-chain acyl-CoA synthetase
MATLVSQVVADRPDETAVVDARRTTTWRHLDERVNQLVHSLRRRGLGVGDTVVAVLGNQVELIELSLACLHGGWVLVPVNWHWVVDELAYVLEDADADAVIVDHRWVDVVVAAIEASGDRSVKARVVVGGEAPGLELYEIVLAGEPTEQPQDLERGGPMFYTSGTTGRPKGVRTAIATAGGPPEVFTLIAHSLGPLIDLPPDGGGVQAICGPLYHSAQWMFAMTALCCGASLVLQHRFDADELLSLIDEHGVTNLHLVPTQMRRLLDLPEARRSAFNGSSLRAVLHGAAPCPAEVKRRFIDWFGPIVTEYYGGTEGGFLALLSAEEWLARPGSVGRPVSTVEIVAIGSDGEELGPGEAGDLYFHSLMGNDFEYHNAPEKTSSAHRAAGWGTLGDIGYFDADGYLYLSDRRVDMVVSGGVNIYPAEIEGVLVEHPAIADVAVFGIPDDEMGEQVRAAIELRPGRDWSDQLEAELVALSRERLAGYKCPRTFEVHRSLPRNEAGKLQKSFLRDPHWAGRSTRI